MALTASAIAIAACGADDSPVATADAALDGGGDAPEDTGTPSDAAVTSAWGGDFPPASGFCDAPDATIVGSLPARTIVDTASAARDHARPSTACSAGAGAQVADVVLAVTPPSDGTLVVRSDLPGTEPWIDTVLYVRSGCARDGEELACDDDSAARGGTSRLALEVTGGVVVYVVIDGATSMDVGSVEVGIDFVPPPPLSPGPADRCADATELVFSGDDTMIAIAAGDTTMAMDDHGCAAVPSTQYLPDVFHAFTLADERDVLIEVIPAEYDAAFYVVGDCDDVTGLACVDYGPPGHVESVTLPRLAPGRYVVGIDAFAHTGTPEWERGTYELRVTARRP